LLIAGMRDLSARCVTEDTDNEPLARILLEDLEAAVLQPGASVCAHGLDGRA
jgi:hypothetical protein